jgi:sugar fermentation stimulation protein A
MRMNPQTAKSMATNSTDSGSYLLVIRLEDPCKIAIGALGSMAFESGYFVYVGSARRNLHHRIARHVRTKKKLRWHIDYLLQEARVERVLVSTKKSELELGTALLESPRFEVVKRFGSSDSPLPGHLFFCAKADSAQGVADSLPLEIRTATDEYPLELA